MKIETFEGTIKDQLDRLGGEVGASIKPETRGYTVTLYVDNGQYSVGKFYTTTDVQLHSPQLVRTQVTNLYKSLCQRVIDRNLGEGVMYVR